MSPTLVILVGLPGSGKTTLARWLARNSGLSIVSRDDIRAAMFPHCAYTVTEKRAAFDAMKSAVAVTLGLGRSCCTDGITFASAADRVEMHALAEATSAEAATVWCDVPIAIAQQRVAEDDVTVFPDRTPALVQEVHERFASLPPGTLRLDMTLPVDELGPTLLRYVGGN